MLLLTPVDVTDFFSTCQPEHIPTLATWKPADAPATWKPADAPGWRVAGPTCHAFAWVYRASLVRRLLTAIEQVRCKYDVSPV